MVNLDPIIDDIFMSALERADAADRSAFLAEACAGNPDLRRRVERLLEAQAKNDSFLEAPAPEIQPTVDQQITESPGTVIGPYKLLEQIGEGGMGTVWMAQQQEPLKRLVALKLIKAGMDSKQVIARFEAERQALALMDHANIAKVLDAGTTGEPSGVSRRVAPCSGTRSLTRLGSPEARLGSPVVPPSSTLAIFGWSIKASACRSASKRAMTCFESMPALMSFSATTRLTGWVCWAIHTVPMPPSPICCKSL